MEQDTKTLLDELRGRIEVDRNELELEEEKQSSIHLEVGELRVEAKSAVRQLETDIKFLRSDLDAEIRKDPGKFGIEKITGVAVDSAIMRNEEYRNLENKLVEAQTVSDHFQILLSTVEERKSLLKDLVSLYIYNYYSQNNHSGEKTELKDLADSRYKQFKEDKYSRNENDGEERSSKTD